jgi:CRP-like cAMP-binding protein
MFVVLQGNVALWINGQEVERLEAGGVLGEMGLIDSAPRSASAVATTDCKLVPIDQKRFSFLVQQTPNFALQIMRVVVDRLRRMDQRL